MDTPADPATPFAEVYQAYCRRPGKAGHEDSAGLAVHGALPFSRAGISSASTSVPSCMTDLRNPLCGLSHW